MKRIRNFFKLLVSSGKSFIEDDALKLSASLSYYTIFALGPVLLLVISFAGIFYGKEAVQGKIFGEIKGLVGNSAAYQIQHIISSIEKNDNSVTGAIIGFVILIFGATGVFTEIQGSINYIWSIRAKPKKGWVRILINRLTSFSLVVATSFILLVALIVNAVLDLFNEKLASIFPETALVVFYIFNNVTIFVVISAMFAIIYRVLPDATISWKDALLGAGFTAILFLAGKSLIGLYLGNSNFGITYGTAASIMIILAWVYYSSMILYFGATFTKLYALNYGSGIIPDETAVFIIKSETKEINKT
ncbi:YihY/virulence factor BrkB family protein [Flavihumibacter sp. ZG627]|uniref:YihY/virulence factor BrkB family protein n=1 Tax=Flavihumibacter sp. ZG627 TaxID=1463156 RepID=UPI00057C66B2|nr:YihY/virulence factor BrkB family protein [Flavihumibacter sp. ZG627]KIC90863.1 ribonuclease BN [Flavihumibacter sp. ZG627]